MEPMDLNVKVYKKQSPYRTIFIFILGVLIGFALFYTYSQFVSTPPPKEGPIQPQITKQEPTKTPETEPEKVKPVENEEQKILAEIKVTSPFIYIIDEEKFSDETLSLIQQIHPLGILIRNSQGELNHERFLSIIDKVNQTLHTENRLLPLIAINFNLNKLSNFPEFSDLPKLSEFNTTTDTAKIIEAGTLYAQKARDIGISMFLGPMFELYVPGRIPDTEKINYIGETTELIQYVGLSFIQGIWQGKVIPIVKNFPSKSLATKKEINTRITYALEIDTKEGDTNQAISQLATWLFPFSEATHQKCPALLVSHVAIPLLDDENPYLPASVSQKIVYGLIRGKWAYEGVVIADDIAEYPLNTGESIPSIALQMFGVGIDLISTSLTDINLLTEIRDKFEQNFSQEAKEIRVKRLSNLIMGVLPLPRKEVTPTPPIESPAPPTPPTETTLIAQNTGTTTQLPAEQTDKSTPEPTTQEQPAITPQPAHTPQEQPPTPPQETTPKEQTTSPTPETTTPAPSAGSMPESVSQATSALPPSELPTEKPPITQEKLVQDLSQIAEKTNIKKEEQKATEKVQEPTNKKEDKSEPPKVATQEEKSETKQAKIQKVPQPPGTKEIKHQIARGETLYNIAQRYGVKPKDIIDWNGIDNPNLIKYGLRLVIYVPQGTTLPPPQTPPPTQKPPAPTNKKGPEITPITLPDTDEGEKEPPQVAVEPLEPKPEVKEEKSEATAETTPQKPAPTGETFIYIVKHGDTLESIARDNRVSKEEIIQINNLKKPYFLPAGRKLKIPRVPKVGFN